MTTPRSALRTCMAARCKRQVFDVQLIKVRGAPVLEVVDSVPLSWAEGARIKLIPSEHALPGQQLAEKLTAAQAHRAFATPHLYVPHADVCPAQKKKTGKKKADRGTHD